MWFVLVLVKETLLRLLYQYRSISDHGNVLLFWEVFYSFWLATLLFPISRGKQVWVTLNVRHSCCKSIAKRSQKWNFAQSSTWRRKQTVHKGDRKCPIIVYERLISIFPPNGPESRGKRVRLSRGGTERIRRYRHVLLGAEQGGTGL